jgi:Dolichyl-phosphate-mannose-protein mannosyltransferase
MPDRDEPIPAASDAAAPPASASPGLRGRAAARMRDPWTWGIVGLVLVALVVRLWGIVYGLPFAYNLDERSHFVPRAVEFFASGSINPNYQLNPSGLIEWIAAALAVVHRSSSAVVDTWNRDPGEIWVVARVSGALLATASVGLLYLAGARLFRDRRVGFLAAALLATCFLPVHYAHLALNDAPSLAPTAFCLWAVAGILRFGRRRDYALAGLAVGLAVGLKYNAAFMLLPIITVAGIVSVRGPEDTGERADAAWERLKPVVIGLLLAGAAALAGFFISDPYAFLDPHRFKEDIQHLSDYTKGGLLLGETRHSGYSYYVWSIGWGMGYIPALLTLFGGVVLIFRERARALILLPAPIVFFLYVGSAGRYFARYVMPIYPVMILVAAAGAVWLASWLGARLNASRRVRTALVVGIGILACAQGIVYVVHNDVVLSRQDTRTAARNWMVDNIPAGTPIVVEPIVPREWYIDGGRPPQAGSQAGYRWPRFVRSREDIRALAKQFRGARRNADFANYEYTLFPGLIDYLRRKGVCWYVSGSMQSGRAFNNPARTPKAIRFYRALDREATLAYQASPYGKPGEGPKHPFQYDQSFDYYPLSFVRPGPVMRVYRLKNCTPASPAVKAAVVRTPQTR